MENPPLVMSVSYGSYEEFVAPSYASSFNTEAMKLAAVGVTLLVASGDDGVANFLARKNPVYCGYFPDFPSVVPYFTVVGGTQVILS